MPIQWSSLKEEMDIKHRLETGGVQKCRRAVTGSVFLWMNVGMISNARGLIPAKKSILSLTPRGETAGLYRAEKSHL